MGERVPSESASDIDTIVARAASVGVGVYSIAPSFIGPPPSAGLLLGYSSLDEAQITAGVVALARVLARPPLSRPRSTRRAAPAA